MRKQKILQSRTIGLSDLSIGNGSAIGRPIPDAVAAEQKQRFWSEKLADLHLTVLLRWPKSYRVGGAEWVRSPEVAIPGDVLRGLKELAQTVGVPLKSVLLAAHYRVLSFLHGNPDMISGLVTIGGTEKLYGGRMIGLLPYTVPLLMQMPGGTWIDLVRKMFSAESELLPYCDYPLAEILCITGNRQLFESAFDFLRLHVNQDLEGCKDMGMPDGNYFKASNVIMLTIFMMDVTATHLQMHVDYNPAELCFGQIQAMLGYYVCTLTTMVQVPTGRYEKFCPLSNAEYQQILVDWNAARRNYPKDRCLHNLVEKRVWNSPDAIALVSGNKSLTYGELNRRANRLAHHLISMGVEPDVLVGLCVERSVDMVAAMLAVLKAGGAYVPLDPNYPAEWLAFVIEDTKIPILITQTSLLPRLPHHSATVVCIDETEAVSKWKQGANDENPRVRITSANLAYVIYTSGSTGRPKGVAIEHHGPVNLVDWAGDIYNPAELSGVLASTSICFDLSVFELFGTLCNGGRVILAENALQLESLPAAQQITLLNTVPSVMKELLRLKTLPLSVRIVNLAGEPLSQEMVWQLYQLPGIEKVYDLYGPSETTTYSIFTLRQPNGPCIIGRPLANTQIYLLDAEKHPAPIAVPGELYIGGDGIARGYLNRPELTAERFIPDPFSRVPGARLYRTGDLARYLPDGNIEFLGRIDHQVKIRGFRIELGEIETMLRSHAGVKDAVVAAREDGSGEKRLVAYVVPAEEHGPIDELRRFLIERLPDYMVPSAFVIMEALPLMPNGKMDRKALPDPAHTRPEIKEAYVAPRTPAETVLVDIWCEMLRMEEVGVLDNFFELGGRSLQVTQVVSRLREVFLVELPLLSFFESPTIEGLVKTLHVAGNPEQVDRRAALFLRVAELSEDEVNTMLEDRLRHER
ncbi:MAG: amino acid adenylation domain-containing protein [Thermodesulfovibrionales bacterium]